MDKNSLRREARLVRSQAAADASDAERLAAAQFLASLRLTAKAMVSLYCPMRDEMDTAHLFHYLDWAGHPTALPVMEQKEKPLSFRAWKSGDDLQEASFGTREPLNTAAPVIPDVVLLPLLAFDKSGFRLGYGGGYYDRTLAALREAGDVLAVGFGYAAQEVAELPRQDHDQKMDWMVTEKDVRSFL